MSQRLRIDERRYDPEERAIVRTAVAIAYGIGLIVLVYFAAFVAGTV